LGGFGSATIGPIGTTGGLMMPPKPSRVDAVYCVCSAVLGAATAKVSDSALLAVSSPVPSGAAPSLAPPQAVDRPTDTRASNSVIRRMAFSSFELAGLCARPVPELP
jgi:hypothetical protein